MDQRDQDARDEQQREVDGERAGDVADGEDADIDEQQQLAREAAGEGRERGTADGDAERIEADEQARGRDRDHQVGRNVGQDAGDDELGAADREGGEEEGEEGRRHQAVTGVRRSAVQEARAMRPEIVLQTMPTMGSTV